METAWIWFWIIVVVAAAALFHWLWEEHQEDEEREAKRKQEDKKKRQEEQEEARRMEEALPYGAWSETITGSVRGMAVTAVSWVPLDEPLGYKGSSPPREAIVAHIRARCPRARALLEAKGIFISPPLPDPAPATLVFLEPAPVPRPGPAAPPVPVPPTPIDRKGIDAASWKIYLELEREGLHGEEWDRRLSALADSVANPLVPAGGITARVRQIREGASTY